MRRLALLVAVLAWSLPGAARAQQRAATPPAPPAATFISQSLWTTGFSALASGDPHFAYLARVNADLDVIDYVAGRLNFFGQYEGVLGTERRRLDLNHENFVVEASATRRVRSSEIGVAFHHVSRHLIDREFEGVTAWNEATFRAAHVLTARGTKYWGHVDVSKVLQHSNVDYSWITRVELDLDRPLNANHAIRSHGKRDARADQGPGDPPSPVRRARRGRDRVRRAKGRDGSVRRVRAPHRRLPDFTLEGALVGDRIQTHRIKLEVRAGSTGSTVPYFASRDLLVQNRRRDDAVVEVVEIELLVRRVRVLVGQADTEEHRRHAQLFLERRDDRNRSALAAEDGRRCRSPARSRGRRPGRTDCRTP